MTLDYQIFEKTIPKLPLCHLIVELKLAAGCRRITLTSLYALRVIIILLFKNTFRLILKLRNNILS